MQQVTGKPLFKAPINRSADEFLSESEVHGWPSFRDDEVVWENVRVLKSSGETVSVSISIYQYDLSRFGRYCSNCFQLLKIMHYYLFAYRSTELISVITCLIARETDIV
jgi:hypothetical protein